MRLPHEIPTGARIVVRVSAGTDAQTGRMTYRDAIGHVITWNGRTLDLLRDPAANGSRPAQRISINAQSIVALKPIPERHLPDRDHREPPDRHITSLA